jgi:hypothetical protein
MTLRHDLGLPGVDTDPVLVMGPVRLGWPLLLRSRDVGCRCVSWRPGYKLPRRYGPWVSRDDVVEYLDDYEG